MDERVDFRDSAEQWFALRVKSRCEKVVATLVRNKGFEGFLPLYESRRAWSDRVKRVEMPLFPGYVFCRLDSQRRLPILTIPGVLHFVGIGKTPAPIENKEIKAIQRAIGAGVPAEPWPYVEVGQAIRLASGPLAGLEGIFVRSSNKERVIVSITLLRRSVAVAIEPHWAIPVDEQGRPVTKALRPSLRQSCPYA